jgi:GR25 family glycosyltransferase involved in LPS biosynthesis
MVCSNSYQESNRYLGGSRRLVGLIYFNDFFKNPLVINLDRRTDRMEQFDKQAKELNIKYERLQAVEASDPRFGCKLSHMAALSKYDSEVIFVFEDDSIFVDNFEAQFQMAMSNVPDDWDMLYFGAHLLQKEPYNDYWVRSLECSSTHAYAVRKRVKGRLIKQAMSMEGHTDVAFSSLHKDIKAYAARPTLVYQGASYSDLQGRDVDYKYLYF